METKLITKLDNYYTAFVLYAQDSITHKTLQLHCTHKYLGAQTPTMMRNVSQVVKRWFNAAPRKFPRAVFNQEARWLKRDPDTGVVTDQMFRVLKSFIHADNFWPELRRDLRVFREDEHPEYTPHITVDHYPSITGFFQCYAIMRREEVILYWRNKEWEAREKEEQEKQARLAKRRGLISLNE